MKTIEQILKELNSVVKGKQKLQNNAETWNLIGSGKFHELNATEEEIKEFIENNPYKNIV